MKITDQLGGRYEVVDHAIPEQAISRREQDGGDEVVELRQFNTEQIRPAIDAAMAANPNKGQIEVLDEVMRAARLPHVKISDEQGNVHRVYSYHPVKGSGGNAVLGFAGEVMTPAFYEQRRDAAENERINLLAQQSEIEQLQASIDEALDADSLDLAGWKAFLDPLVEDKETVAQLHNLRSAKRHAENLSLECDKILARIPAAIEQAIYDRDRNQKEAQVADGVKNVEQVGAEVAKIK